MLNIFLRARGLHNCHQRWDLALEEKRCRGRIGGGGTPVTVCYPGPVFGWLKRRWENRWSEAFHESKDRSLMPKSWKGPWIKNVLFHDLPLYFNINEMLSLTRIGTRLQFPVARPLGMKLSIGSSLFERKLVPPSITSIYKEGVRPSIWDNKSGEKLNIFLEYWIVNEFVQIFVPFRLVNKPWVILISLRRADCPTG